VIEFIAFWLTRDARPMYVGHFVCHVLGELGPWFTRACAFTSFRYHLILGLKYYLTCGRSMDIRDSCSWDIPSHVRRVLFPYVSTASRRSQIANRKSSFSLLSRLQSNGTPTPSTSLVGQYSSAPSSCSFPAYYFSSSSSSLYSICGSCFTDWYQVHLIAVC
jgi:hypothetical protein